MNKTKNKSDYGKDNHERWLISYADFITLLFTFFAALYALSSIDKHKAEQVSASLNAAFKVIDSPVVKGTSDSQNLLEQIRAMFQGISGVSAKIDSRGIIITFANETLFDSGSADINPNGISTLSRLNSVLNSTKSAIFVEGHTDNLPISTSSFKSNWELSASRAASVARFYIDKGIAPQRFIISGFAEFRPVAPNDTPENRAKNRRVQIILTKEGL